MRKSLILASVLVVAGCAQPTYQAGYPSGYSSGSPSYSPKPVPARTPTPPPVKKEEPKIVNVEDDAFSKKITVTEFVQKTDPFVESTYLHMLRSWIERDTGKVSHQIYVVNVYSKDGWHMWQRANDQSANELEFTSIERNVSSCSGGRARSCVHNEDFGLEVSDAVLRNSAASGYPFKIYAKSGESQVLTVTPEQINKQVAAIDQKLGRAPQAMFQKPTVIEQPRPAPDQPMFQNPRQPYQPPMQNNAPAYPTPNYSTDEADNSMDNQNQSYPSGVFPPAQYPQAQQAPRPLAPQNGGGVAYPAPIRQY